MNFELNFERYQKGLISRLTNNFKRECIEKIMDAHKLAFNNYVKIEYEREQDYFCIGLEKTSKKSDYFQAKLKEYLFEYETPKQYRGECKLKSLKDFYYETLIDRSFNKILFEMQNPFALNNNRVDLLKYTKAIALNKFINVIENRIKNKNFKSFEDSKANLPFNFNQAIKVDIVAFLIKRGFINGSERENCIKFFSNGFDGKLIFKDKISANELADFFRKIYEYNSKDVENKKKLSFREVFEYVSQNSNKAIKENMSGSSKRVDENNKLIKQIFGEKTI
jgi:hypothetical protein